MITILLSLIIAYLAGYAYSQLLLITPRFTKKAPILLLRLGVFLLFLTLQLQMPQLQLILGLTTFMVVVWYRILKGSCEKF